MRIRKQPLGDKNIVGARIEKRRKDLCMKQKELLDLLTANGLDLNASGLSKIEGCLRQINDVELIAMSKALGVSVDWLLGLEK